MFSVNCNCSFSIIGQPLDGLNNLGPSWSGFNAVIGAEQNKTLPLDLMEVELHNGRKIISFLGVTIGLVADVDLGNLLKLAEKRVLLRYGVATRFHAKNSFP